MVPKLVPDFPFRNPFNQVESGRTATTDESRNLATSKTVTTVIKAQNCSCSRHCNRNRKSRRFNRNRKSKRFNRNRRQKTITTTWSITSKRAGAFTAQFFFHLKIPIRLHEHKNVLSHCELFYIKFLFCLEYFLCFSFILLPVNLI